MAAPQDQIRGVFRCPSFSWSDKWGVKSVTFSILLHFMGASLSDHLKRNLISNKVIARDGVRRSSLGMIIRQ